MLANKEQISFTLKFLINQRYGFINNKINSFLKITLSDNKFPDNWASIHEEIHQAFLAIHYYENYYLKLNQKKRESF